MKKIILSSLLLFTIISCREHNNDGEVLSEEFFQTSEQAFAAVDALYTCGAPSFYGYASTMSGPVSAIGGYLSGYFDNESKKEVPLAGFCQQLTFDDTNISGVIDNIWNQAYGSIEQANMIIKKLTLSTIISEDEKILLIAESRFFIAFNYFYLVRYFGDIPLLQGVKTWQESPKSSMADVYQFIIADLKVAIGRLSDRASRISPFMAKTLLCDMYLTASGFPLRADYYQEAAQLARDIIQNGPYSLVANDSLSGVSAHRILYKTNSPELIYSYPQTSNTFATLSFSKSASSWGVFSKETNNAYKPVKDFLNIYDSEVDWRGSEGIFFHTFYKYEKDDRTVIQSFEPSPYLWFDDALIGSGNVMTKDISIYRFAEVLLNAAEAIANVDGVTSEAIEYLTKVRSRAYRNVNSLEITTQLSGLNKEQFIEEVWKERLREFPLEMKIWSDIQRTRKYPIPVKGGTITFIDIIGSTNSWGAVYGSEVLLLPVTKHTK